MRRGEANGTRIETNGEPEKPGHVASDLCELRRGGARGGVSNAGSQVLGWGKEVDDEVDDVVAELWAEQLGGAGEEARRSAAELAEDDGGENVEL